VARILVVDDEPDVLFMTAYALRALGGHEVSEARNGIDGLSMARQLRPDLVVLDIKMPQMDGIAVCRGIRETPGMETTPVILLSARGQRAEVEEGWAAGASDYIIKPYAPDVLVRRVSELLKA
jgi:DNA-binding response OmpR family regulator